MVVTDAGVVVVVVMAAWVVVLLVVVVAGAGVVVVVATGGWVLPPGRGLEEKERLTSFGMLGWWIGLACFRN